MSGIVVPRNAIPLMNQERNRSTSTPAQNLPAQRFQDILSETTRLQGDKTLRATPDQPSLDSNYTIQQGDTLSEIVATESKKLGINHSRRDLYNMVNRVADLNHLTHPDTIFRGQEVDLSGLTQPISEPASKPRSEPISSSVLEPLTATRNAHDLLPESSFRSPVNGRITSLFGMRSHPVLGEMRHHDGIDISQPTGAPVKPLTSGTVTFSGNDGGYGLMVEIDHGNGLTSRYAHLSKLLVRKGEQISPEQTIGQVGQTGMTTGPHLHLEIQRQNTPIDPLTVLSRQQIEPSLILAEARRTQRS